MDATASPIKRSFPSYSLAEGVKLLAQVFRKQLLDDLYLEEFRGACGTEQLLGAQRLLERHGLVSQLILDSANCRDLQVPHLRVLTDGQTITVVSHDDQHLYIADPRINSGVHRVALAEVNQDLLGPALLTAESIDNIEKRLLPASAPGNWFWQECKNLRPIIKDAVLGSLCANLLATCVALFSLQVYDRVIPHQSESTLWILASGVAIAIIIEASLRLARAQLLDASGRQLEVRLSDFLFHRLVGSRLSGNNIEPSAKVNAIREFGAVREFFTTASIGSLADLPFAFLFLALIFLIAGDVGYLIALAMAIIIVPSLLMRNKMAELSNEMMGGASAANKVLIESAYTGESIKSHQAESFFQKKWTDIVSLNAEKTTEQRLLSAGLSYSAAALQQTAYVTAVIAGTYLVFSGEFTVGSIIAVSILSTRTLAPVTQLSTIILRWQQVRTALSALDAIAESDQDIPNERQFLQAEIVSGKIDIERLSFSYDGAPEQLSISTLNIQGGEQVALLGANGAGKSTLLKVISGLYDFSSGNLTIDDIDIRQIEPRDLRRQIYYLPQEVRLIAGTLRDNLTFGSQRFDEARLVEALQFAGLADLVAKDPKGLDLDILDGGMGLSLGQRQSVGLARMYLRDPKILLLDEPTASLDQGLENRVIQRLSEWLTGRTCIITTHRLPPLKLAARIVVLHQGKIALDEEKSIALEKLGAGSVVSSFKRNSGDGQDEAA